MYLQKLIDIGEDVKLELNESNTQWYVVLKHLDTLIGIFMETTKAVLMQQMKVRLTSTVAVNILVTDRELDLI